MDGSAQWTEMGSELGLDHLAMLSPIEGLYQSLLPGFSSVTTRLRNYSFHTWCVARYSKEIRQGSRKVFQEHTRRTEALYALASGQRIDETGVAGSTFAAIKLHSLGSRIDFRVETDMATPREQRYLVPDGGAFPGIYFGQMLEIGLIERGEEHRLPVPTEAGLELAAAYSASVTPAAVRFFEFAAQGQIPRNELAPMICMAPSSLDQDSPEAQILRSLLMGEDGSKSSLSRRATLLSILEIAARVGSEKLTEPMLRWWWMENPPNGANSEAHRSWQHYQVGDLLRLVYECLINHAILILEDAPHGLAKASLVGEVTRAVPEIPCAEWLGELATAKPDVSLREVQRLALDQGAPLEAIVTLLARIWTGWRSRLEELKVSFPEEPGFQTCFTELRWLEEREDLSARLVISELLYERVLRRHLEVAARKFRLQGSYTYLVEIEDARLRARSKVNVGPSGPRLGTALQFLHDVGLLAEGKITPRGQAYLEAV